MTTWPARRRGDRILCGWTVDGRANCGVVLGEIVHPPPIFGVRFLEIYEQAGPPVPGVLTTLRIGTYANAKLRRGQTPKRRRPIGANVVHGLYAPARPEHVQLGLFAATSLPVVVPCLHGHENMVVSATLDPVD